jgi:hypothetical protein
MTEQEKQVYHTLQKWAERLNAWEYNNQVKRNKGKKLKSFSPNAFSLQLIENCKRMLNKEITAEQAMSILATTEGRTETRLCMEAGF